MASISTLGTLLAYTLLHTLIGYDEGRKLRSSDARHGKGRRGGLRVIYYYFSFDEQIWFMTIYSKDDAEDLSADQKKVLKTAIDSELSTRRAKQGRRSRRS
jgi:hypothetical protein